MKKAVEFFKNETVLCAALILAAVSCFIVPPDARYADYIDFRTLAVLFCLMTVMAGLRSLGVFEVMASKVLGVCKSVRVQVTILVMLCFFSSMLITNDVALITFVPFTFTVLKLCGKEDRLLIPTVAMQTAAANLGSMLTPLGNPQNLYLYTKSGVGVGEFMRLMLPYTALSFIAILIWCIMQKSSGGAAVSVKDTKTRISSTRKAWMYAALFIISLLCVLRIVPFLAALAAVLAAVLIFDRHTLAKVDYSLLLTFIGFFIFIGNLGRADVFCAFLRNIIEGHEAVTAIAASQVISNVPAAILLSGFTDNLNELIIGTNIGGLGTLIASMASLISFKYIAVSDKTLRGRYLLYFTAVNIILLAGLIVLYFCIN